MEMKISSRLNEGQSYRARSAEIGLWIIALVIIASLFACLGFEVEWIAIHMGLSDSLVRSAFFIIGWLTVIVVFALSLIVTISRSSSTRREVYATLFIYLSLLLLTPRSFTYDTGLYHVPVIFHLKELGLEWNMGWLHSRYGFFNLFLYGQAAIARITDVAALPSLNGVIAAATISYVIFSIRDFGRLVGSLGVVMLLVFPSESSAGFHSYNADFSLGCSYLVAGLALTDNTKRLSATVYWPALIISFNLPLIKLSGLFLVPILVASGLSRSFRAMLEVIRSRLFCVLMLTSITVLCGFGMITTGYLAYPAYQTGPLRHDSLPKQQAINEARVNTLAFARFAYNIGGSDKVLYDAKLTSWFPDWSKSINGRKLLTYASLSIIGSVFSVARLGLNRRSVLFIVNAIGLVSSIIFLPPDPRFYLGPALIAVYSLGMLIPKSREVAALSYHRSGMCLIALFYTIALLLFVYEWRPSDVPSLEFPKDRKGTSTGLTSLGEYSTRGNNTIFRSSSEGMCWHTKAPCMP